MRISFRNECPYCTSTYFMRIPRKSYLRFSSAIKCYECDLCRKEFAIIERRQQPAPASKPSLIHIEGTSHSVKR